MRPRSIRLLSLLLCLCMLAGISAIAAPRAAAATVDFYYSLSNGYATIDSVRADFKGVFRIPTYVGAENDKHLVTAIGDNAFANVAGLTAVEMTKYISRIGVGAFGGCKNLASVTLSSALKTIGANAFAGTALTKITLPASVTTVDGNVFYNCQKLTSIAVAAENTHFSTLYGSLYNYAGTKLISFPAGKTAENLTLAANVAEVGAYACALSRSIKKLSGSGLKKIGVGAFNGCAALESATLPAGVTEIGAYAFQGCTRLTAFRIPAGVKDLDVSAFYDSGISRFTVDAASTSFSAADGVIYNKDRTMLVFYPGARENTVFTIPASVASFYAFTFLKADRLTEIRVAPENAAFYDIDGVVYQKNTNRLLLYPHNAPATVYRIFEKTEDIFMNAFAYAKNLQRVVFPAGLKTIGASAFYGCPNFRSLALPEGVAAVPAALAAACPALATVCLPKTVTSVAADAFAGDTALKKLYFTGSSQAYQALGVVLPKGAQAIPGHAHTAYTSVAVAAKCAETGVSIECCDVCAMRVSRVTPATGSHSYGAWTVTRAASFTFPGEEKRVCRVCGREDLRSIRRLEQLPAGAAFTAADETNALLYVLPRVRVQELAAAFPALTVTDTHGAALTPGTQVYTGMRLADPAAGEREPKLVYTVVVPGDVDCDGAIGAADARLALRASVSLEPLTVYAAAAAALRETEISAAEARLILRASVELEDPGEWVRGE